MDTQDTNSWTAGGARLRTGTRRLPPDEPHQASREHPLQQAPTQRTRRSPTTTREARELARRYPPTVPDPAKPKEIDTKRAGRQWTRPPRTWAQRLGGLLIAGVCVLCAVWYVPHVASNDRQLLTGTVTSTGVIVLNFSVSGEISKMNVRLGQTVRKGRVLAALYAPNTDAVVAAETAAIASDQAKIIQLHAAEAADPDAAAVDTAQLAADNAQLALDEAQLAADRAKAVASEIVAPSFGTVVAANGQPGEIVTAAGIREYAADSQQATAAQRPAFSLFPEGPQSVRRAPPSGSSLPVLALRTSTSWQVVALIPEDRVPQITPGQTVTIGVPATHIVDVRGKIEEVLPNPIQTSDGTVYQAVVTITGHARSLPLNGMAADIQLGS
jgi:multidrug resistance efflux pump